MEKNQDTAQQKVCVGLSGGVDSSVTAALLKQQGYDVVGVYMKNWSDESPTLGRRQLDRDAYRMECPWYDDYLDAKRVALQLDIPFMMWDFRESYKQKVFDHIIDEFEKGRTPNPDIYCNSLVKFDDFLAKAVSELGVDYVATGHYAEKVVTSEGKASLRIPKDTHKDQTYFLYRLSEQQLAKTLFPLAGYTKDEVRELAKQFNLPTKYKKDSQGICFIGEVEVRDFLTKWLAPKPGAILTLEGQEVGTHRGVHLYTIGEKIAVDNARIAELSPAEKDKIPTFYIAEKRVNENILVVVPGGENPELYKTRITLEDPTWNLEKPLEGVRLHARVRHGGSLNNCSLHCVGDSVTVVFDKPQRALADGQHLVLYNAEGTVVGGGVMIASS